MLAERVLYTASVSSFVRFRYTLTAAVASIWILYVVADVVAGESKKVIVNDSKKVFYVEIGEDEDLEEQEIIKKLKEQFDEIMDRKLKNETRNNS